MKKSDRRKLKAFLDEHTQVSEQSLRKIRSVAEYEIRHTESSSFNYKWLTSAAVLLISVFYFATSLSIESDFDRLYNYDQNLISEVNTMKQSYELVFEDQGFLTKEETETQAMDELTENMNLILDEI